MLAGMEPDEREIGLRLVALTHNLILVTGDTFRFYEDLAPDGHELSSEERGQVTERLELATLCLRELNVDSDLLSNLAGQGKLDFRPAVAVLRMMQRNLVLVLSNNPERRAQAISGPELIPYVRSAYDFFAEAYGLPPWSVLPSIDPR
jgi:hypothetical protein